MSYILDALKKSEQERGHGNIPDVQTIHSSSLNYRSEKKAYWPYILIAAVVLNLLAIIYFIVNRQAPEAMNASTQQENVLTPTITKNDAAPEKTKVNETPAIIINDENKNTATGQAGIDATITTNKNTAPAKETETVEIKTREVTAESDSRILEFYELPESIKQNLPSFVISAHVYSTNPLQRSIVINNNFLEEDEYVLDDLILHEITPDGAIFNYKGTLFRYGVVSGWQ